MQRKIVHSEIIKLKKSFRIFPMGFVRRSTMSAILLWIFLFLQSCGLHRAEQLYCSKIDFNQPLVSGFRECIGRNVPMFQVKKYVDTPWLPPYRPSSEYYLSNALEGYSCAESEPNFHLNANSEIDVAIYLNFQFRGAYIEILVIDADTRQTINRWKNETAAGWFLLRKNLRTTVQNAQIEFRVNSNKNSRLAIEYIYVLNSAINLAECWRNPIETTLPSTSETDTSDTTQPTTEVTPTEPTSAESMSAGEIWTIIGIAIGVFLLILLLLLIIYVVIRNRRRKLLIVAAQLPARSTEHNNYATLPRLRVVTDKVNGVSIVGGDNNNGNQNSNANYPN